MPTTAVLSISVTADWDKKTVDPIVMAPLCKNNAANCIGVQGKRDGLKSFLNPIDAKDGAEFARKYLPDELRIYEANAPLTVKQAITIAGCLLEVEAKADSDYVGFPFAIAVIGRSERGAVMIRRESDQPLCPGEKKGAKR